jgi:hypothetical protein
VTEGAGPESVDEGRGVGGASHDSARTCAGAGTGTTGTWSAKSLFAVPAVIIPHVPKPKRCVSYGSVCAQWKD